MTQQDDSSEKYEAVKMNAEAWNDLPDVLRRVGASQARLRRLQAVGAPAIILRKERDLLRARIPALRDYLDLLELELAQPED